MVKILVTDDNPKKIKELRGLLDGIPELTKYDVAQDVITAKRLLSVNHYDLLILDLQLPLRVGDDPKPSNGIDFLNEINRSNRLVKPFHIIGFTEFDELHTEFAQNFDDELWTLIKFEPSSKVWQKRLMRKIEYLLQSKRDLLQGGQQNYEYDLAIVTALRQTELESVLNLDANWTEFTLSNDATEYFKGIFKTSDDKKIKVVAAAAPQMGMVASSVLAMKMITAFRPKYVAMCGIAAGIEGLGNLGDILVCDISFDSGSGKIKTDVDGNSIFLADYKSINLGVDFQESFLSCKAKREYLDEIKRRWVADKPHTELNIHVGPLASGAGVIQHAKIVQEIQGHARTLIGIDMESYGIFYAVKHCQKPRPIAALSIKSITDFADANKSDNYQKYAAYTSASFLYKFATEKINYDVGSVFA